MIKNIPLGIENFIEANEKYFVDKSLIIRDIIENCIGRPLLVTRPRRFGKSLTLSMIDYFFTNKGDYADKFKDKKIYKEKRCVEFLNQYPVIHLNMKDVSRNNYDDLMDVTLNRISSIYRDFPEISQMDFVYEYEKKQFYSFANREYTNPFDYVDSIRFLSSLLYKKYNKKVVILIDEYDTPLEISYQNGFYDKSIEFFKRFYSSTLKANENILFSFTTGVLQIGKESIFSELNNMNTYDVTNRIFQEYFGFTKEEVIELFNHFGVNFDGEKIREYYGGYGNDDLEIYNPWSILNYVENEKYYSYWVNTGSNITISNLVKSIPNSIELLNEFINNDKLSFKFNNSLSYGDIKNNKETLFSYLLQAGYLVAKKDKEDKLFNIFIPNIELKEVFEREIIERNTDENIVDLAYGIRKSLFNGDIERLKDYLNNFIESSFSYYDLTNEREYQIMVSTLLSVLFTDYLIKNEVNNRYGRCDIMMVPKNKEMMGVIIELKFYKGRLGAKALKEKSKIALNQIVDNKYFVELNKIGLKKNILFGFAFDKNNSAISYKEI